MKTEADFVAAFKVFMVSKKKNVPKVFALSLSCLALALGTIFILDYTHLISGRLIQPLLMFTGIFMVVPAAAYSVWFNRKAAQEAGLVCENCRKVFSKPTDFLRLIQSRNCPYCGSPVLS